MAKIKPMRHLPRTIKYLSFLLLYCFAPILLAGSTTVTNTSISGVFSPPSTDYSVTLLGMIFGANVGSIYLGGYSSPILVHMFNSLNIIVISIGTLILSYIGIVSTINTAQEGEVMGKKWSSIWIPMRSLIGILLMVPTPASGYSIIQVTVLWIILQGIGTADQIWNTVLTDLSSSSVTAAPSVQNTADTGNLASNTSGLTKLLLYSAVCSQAMNMIYSDQATISLANGRTTPIIPSANVELYGSSIKPYLSTSNCTTSGSGSSGFATCTGTFNVGVNDPSNPFASICGKYNINITTAVPELTPGMPNADVNDALTAVNDVYSIQGTALKVMYSNILPLAKWIVNQTSTSNISGVTRLSTNTVPLLYGRLITPINTANIPNIEQLGTAQNYYMTAVSALIAPAPDPSGTLQSNINFGQTSGWISAGAFYFTLTQPPPPSKLLKAATTTPSTTMSGSTQITVPFCNNCLSTNSNYTNSNAYLIFSQAGLSNSGINPEIQYLVGMLHDANIITQNFTPASAAGAKNVTQSINAMMPISTIIAGMLPMLVNPASGGVFFVLWAFMAIIVELGVSYLQNIMSFSGSGTDPMMLISQCGSNLMQLAETSMITYLDVMMGVAALATILSVEVLGDGIPEAGEAVLLPLFFVSTIIFGMLALLWTMGATLSIYTPMIPYLIFTISAVGWLLLVIEAVVAAPILSLSIVLPSQDELGKLVTGIGILAGIIIRPALSIFGFVLSIKLFGAVVSLVNYTIGGAMSALPGISIFSAIPIMGFYIFFIISLANKCFSLIYEIPNKALRWIGVQGEQVSVAEEMKGAQAGFEKGAAGGAALMKMPADTGKAAAESGLKKLGNKLRPPKE